MRSSHSLDRLDTAFDDHRLAADAGLLLPATLAHHLGLKGLVDEHLDCATHQCSARRAGDRFLDLGQLHQALGQNLGRNSALHGDRRGAILGTEREMADAVAIGALQGTRGGMFEDASIKFNIVLLPYLVESWDQAICLARSPWMMKIAAEGRLKGFHIPAVGISQGFRAHGSKKRSVDFFE